MTFKEWLDEKFGTEVDVNDLEEDDYIDLQEEYEMT